MSDESSTAPDPERAAERIVEIGGRVVEIGGRLGRYRIDDVIGAGGRGIVLAARDPELARSIALKVLRRDDAVSQSELLIEGQAMARLRHPNVVSVYDVGVASDRVFIAMELVVGVTLRAWQSRARPWRAVVETYLAAGRGLAAAHAAAVVHADFKPDNVLVGEDGSVRVADFGLASVVRASGRGRIVGTPAYMAPEQHAGAAVGPEADQFAFATALWEALAGSRPFGGTG
ncbi:MAG TPA: serine/threonine-protein kinase, partial [Kofleriaceae bacterium]